MNEPDKTAAPAAAVLGGGEVTCPSGLRGIVRGLRGRELSLLGDAKLARSGLLLDRLIETCWTETIDPGPYDLPDSGKLDWGAALTGDRFFVMLRIRAATHGPLFTFSFACPACGKRDNGWEVNLLELPVRALSAEAAEQFRAGNRLSGVLPDGKTFVFKLTTGTDERRVAQIDDGERMRRAIAMLAGRLHEIEGVDHTRLRQHLEDAPLSDVMQLFDLLSEQDCGVETTFEVECPSCGERPAIDIPFASKTFWFPGRRV